MKHAACTLKVSFIKCKCIQTQLHDKQPCLLQLTDIHQLLELPTVVETLGLQSIPHFECIFHPPAKCMDTCAT